MNKNNRDSCQSVPNRFIWSSTWLFFVFGVLKVIGVFQNAPVLNQIDLLTGISNRHLFLIVGVIEMGSVGVIWCINGTLPRLIWLLSISSGFLLYHFGTWVFEFPEPCPCLGALITWSNFVQSHSRSISLVFASAVFISAAYFALEEHLTQRHKASCRIETT